MANTEHSAGLIMVHRPRIVSRRTKRLRFGLIIIAGSILAVWGGQRIKNFIRPSGSLEFDQRLWKANANQYRDDNPRGLMLDDLGAHHIRAGMTLAQVMEVLGPPDAVFEDNGVQNFDGKKEIKSTDTYLYCVGRWGRTEFMLNYLHFEFGKSGRLTNAWKQHR